MLSRQLVLATLRCLLLLIQHVQTSYLSADVWRYNETDVVLPVENNPCRPIIGVNGEILIAKMRPNYMFPLLIQGITRHYVCILAVDPVCNPNPCENNGACTSSVGAFSCTCPDGFSGSICQKNRYLISVSLYGGNHSGEGRVGFLTKAHPTQIAYMSYTWSMAMSHMVCQDLGFVGAVATMSGDMFPTTGDLMEIGEVHCPLHYSNFTECWYSTIRNRDKGIEWHIAVRCCTSSKCTPPGRALGMESGDILDADITTSSCATTGPCGQEARLNSTTSWMASSNDQTNPYVQIHLGAYHMITAIITLGGTNKWITSFKVSYGSGENDLKIYTDVHNGTEILFPGNYDATTPVTTSLTPHILAKYIRIYPKSSNNAVCMRFELIGYGPLPDYIDQIHERDGTCVTNVGVSLGLENGDTGDESLTASTSEPDHGPHTARLNSATGGGWIPLHTDSDPFLQVDLTVVYLVTGVITQGHHTLDQWTTSTTLSFETDQGWIYVYENECGSRKVYSTNYDNNSRVTILLAEPVMATKVRIYPQSWNDRVALRCEILGHLKGQD